MGLLERHSKDEASVVRAMVVDSPRRVALDPHVRENIAPGSTVITDALRSYDRLADEYTHKVIDHAETYVKGFMAEKQGKWLRGALTEAALAAGRGARADTWSRVDRARGVVVLEAEHAKTEEPREVRLNAHSDAVLVRRRKDGAEYVFAGQHWNAYRSAWEAAVRRAKLSNLRFHDLRHTFAAWLVKQGRPIKEVQEALGHKSLAMTLRYAHLAPENLRAAVASLDCILPVSEITQEITHEAVEREVVSPKSL